LTSQIRQNRPARKTPGIGFGSETVGSKSQIAALPEVGDTGGEFID